MKTNEYTSDRKMRSIFEVSKLQLLAAKVGDEDFDLEDMRFCLDCERWFDANYWIATIEHQGDVAFVCERCAEQFERYSDDAKADELERIEIHFQYWKDELKMARIEAATRTR